MKTFATTLTLFWAFQASTAADVDKDSNKAPAQFHVTKNFVEKTYLRGVNEDELVTADEELSADEEVERLTLSESWLNAHNTRRRKYQRAYGVKYSALKWSSGLEDLAKEWAEKESKTCTNSKPKGVEWGFNGQKHNGKSERTNRINEGWTSYADYTLNLWENKLDKGYPTNEAMTQVLWKATKYVGCYTSLNDADTCGVSVCYYATPGNCAMKNFTGDKWETPTYKEKSRCGPQCPPELTESPEGGCQ